MSIWINDRSQRATTNFAGIDDLIVFKISQNNMHIYMPLWIRRKSSSPRNRPLFRSFVNGACPKPDLVARWNALAKRLTNRAHSRHPISSESPTANFLAAATIDRTGLVNRDGPFRIAKRLRSLKLAENKNSHLRTKLTFLIVKSIFPSS